MTDDVAAQLDQNMRDLKLIREEPAWALSMVQECRRLGKRVEALEAELRQMEARRDWQYDKALGWRNRCVKAEAELRHATDSLVRERLRYHEQRQRAEEAEAERARLAEEYELLIDERVAIHDRIGQALRPEGERCRHGLSFDVHCIECSLQGYCGCQDCRETE